jgi:AAA family ATP:ADP antiporter
MNLRKLQKVLHGLLNYAHEKIKYFHSIPAFAGSQVLKQSIFTEVKTDTIIALKICSMLYDRNQVNRVIELVEQKQNSKIYNGIEMLEIVLTNVFFKEIDKLLEFTMAATNTKEPEENEEKIISILEQIIYTPINFFTPWTKAMCIYLAGKNNFTLLLQMLVTNPIAETDYVIKETKEFILTAYNKPA